MYREGLGSMGAYLQEKGPAKGTSMSQYLKERGPRIAVGGTAYLGALTGLNAAKGYLSVGTLPSALTSMGVGALTSLGVLGAILGAGWLGYKGINWLWNFAGKMNKEAKDRETKTASSPTPA